MCHGTIEERYGHDILVRAIAVARHTLPGLRLVVTGGGTYADEFLRLVDELGVGDIVKFPGFVSTEELADRLARADVGVVAQRRNDYSELVHTCKMFDYLAVGVPVVAGRLRATERTFGNGSLAFYDPEDPVDLAKVLVGLAADLPRRRRMVEAGRVALAACGWEAQSAVYLAAFSDVLGRRRAVAVV